MSNHEQDLPPSVHNRAALERAERRALALRATDALSEIFDRKTSIPALLETANSPDDTRDRLLARRALRAVASLAREQSAIVERIGRDELYHYLEAVVDYGASNRLYLELMDTFGLTPEEVTGVYALREQIADQTNGMQPSMQMIIDALAAVGISIQQAVRDSDAALAAFDEAGFITDHTSPKVGTRDRGRQFNSTAFYLPKARTTHRIIADDPDGSVTEGIIEGFKDRLGHPAEESDVPDENHVWRDTVVTDYLRNLGS